jgi:hypothetical protein
MRYNKFMHTTSAQKLLSCLKPGVVYRREDLSPYSKTIDRDLITLIKLGFLQKVSPGVYYMPKKSRFGVLPPDPTLLVKTFLKDDQFLLFSPDVYNALGLGLVQTYNKMIVYNHKRHGVFRLANQEFDFRRPSYGFSKKLTSEFLLVDLLNHASELVDEDVEQLCGKVKYLSLSLLEKALACAEHYGKVKTKKIIRGALNESISARAA